VPAQSLAFAAKRTKQNISCLQLYKHNANAGARSPRPGILCAWAFVIEYNNKGKQRTLIILYYFNDALSLHWEVVMVM
jgi:hypothetical protein